MAERDKVLYFKRRLRTSIKAHVRVQEPQTVSEAIKTAKSADLRANDHHFSNRNGRIAIRQPITTRTEVNQDPRPGLRHQWILGTWR
jgi:hypothetical protein